MAARALLPLAAVLLAVAVTGAAAQDGRQMPGYKYLYSTNLYARMTGDVVRTVNTTAWEQGQNAKAMHKCARTCAREGGGGVCKAWTMCWTERTCHLLSRLPDDLSPAEPGAILGGAVSRAMGYNAYNAQCTSGLSEAAINAARLNDNCKATLRPNTALSDTQGIFVTNRNRVLKEAFDANQPSAADCCALCAKMRRNGCNSWTYSPRGVMLDPTYKCTLRTGENPAMSVARGVTSGFMA